ncbi:homeobox protein ESX1-like isoform X2 [Cervus canadensis]|uniref:homeobox protein ESX1-like isoform X2 n=1 Tax=Cervus canadensis TaxID=1574408 RepID=UPI001CA31334|nr:homeobox protein ESX1-like isoform X2 [Cervus canadensis]
MRGTGCSGGFFIRMYTSFHFGWTPHRPGEGFCRRTRKVYRGFLGVGVLVERRGLGAKETEIFPGSPPSAAARIAAAGATSRDDLLDKDQEERKTREKKKKSGHSKERSKERRKKRSSKRNTRSIVTIVTATLILTQTPVVWFKRRRTKWRNCQRALRFRDAPPLCRAHPVVTNWGGPCNTILIQEPNWVWVLLEPMPLEPMPLEPTPLELTPLEPTPLELMPMPPMPPMLALLPMPPLPPLFLPLPWFLPPPIHPGCPHMALPGPLPPVAFL